MKKIFFILAGLVLLASCSKENDTLTTVNISAKTNLGDSGSKVIWNQLDGTSVPVQFQYNEKFDMYEVGYSGKQEFTNSDPTNWQNGNFSGLWHADATTRWAAILPSSNNNGFRYDDDFNYYTVTLPSEQTPRVRTSSSNTIIYSPDSLANIMLGSTSDHTSTTSFLSPICSYLHFTTSTSITKVKVSASSVSTRVSDRAGKMCGRIQVKTGLRTISNNNQSMAWGGWNEFVNCIRDISVISGSNEIIVNGRVCADHCEYVVCIFPGTYSGLKITDITGQNSNSQAADYNANYGKDIKRYSQSHECKLVNVYDLGQFSTHIADSK